MSKFIVLVGTILLFSCSSNKAKENNDTIAESDNIEEVVESNYEEADKPEISDSTTARISKRLVIGFDGTIDTYPIQMTLRFNESAKESLWGEYSYIRSKSKEKINIWGKFISSDSIQLDESHYNSAEKKSKVLAYLSGRFDSKYNLKGIWKDSATTKTLPLDIKPHIKEFHNNLDFDFVTTKDYDIYDDNPLSYENVSLLKEVKIKNKDKKVIQVLSELSVYIRDGEATIEFMDLNFDGYMDLAVNYIFPTRWKNDWGQLYFLYNPQTRAFERNRELETHEVIFVDYFNKTVKDVSADGSGNESTDAYIYSDGHFYLIKREIWTEEGEYTIINYEVKDGVSVEVSREEK
ncbi:MAG: hypothetical protein E6767_09180 [Dysgonomonas sp.]|nr:hypothetical protein [Dysgonomonas sp.]